MKHQYDMERCLSCGYEVPVDDLVDGICSICDDEAEGFGGSFEKFTKKKKDQDGE